MRKKTWVFLCLLTTILAVEETFDRNKIFFRGYRLLKVGPLVGYDQLSFIQQVLDDHEFSREVVLMSDEHFGVNKALWLIISPDLYNRLSLSMKEHLIHFRIVNEDIQESMDKNARLNEEALAKIKLHSQTFDHTAYLSYSDQVSWLLDTAAGLQTIAVVFSLGQSYQGQDIKAIAINNDDLTLPSVWMHANLNARDWITSASVLYIIDQILNGNTLDAMYLRANFRFYIVPTLNPDGYDYTWTTDRTWRKTLSAAVCENCSCNVTGVFGNGNFDANFGGPGCSNDPCSDSYCGPFAFSEPETSSLKGFLEAMFSQGMGQAALFLTFDSYSQQWLAPFGCQQDAPSDSVELMRVAQLGASAASSINGFDFVVGTPAEFYGITTGMASDWAKLRNVSYAYSIRSRPDSPANGGFDIPPDQIIPSGSELFAGLAAMCKNLVL